MIIMIPHQKVNGSLVALVARRTKCKTFGESALPTLGLLIVQIVQCSTGILSIGSQLYPRKPTLLSSSIIRVRNASQTRCRSSGLFEWFLFYT